METFGVDLLDLGTERLSYPRLARLVVQLPPGARLHRAIVGHAIWTTSEHLLASLIEATVDGNWQRAQLNSKKSIPRPDPIVRPGAKDPKAKNRTTLTPAQIAERLRAQRRAP